MTDNEIIERYFKARGWMSIVRVGGDICNWWDGKSVKGVYAPPLILTDFPAFKEHVLEPMHEEEFILYVFSSYIEWTRKNPSSNRRCKIVDNNILHAAVIAATRYWESKDG